MDKSIQAILSLIPVDLSSFKEDDSVTEIRLRAGCNIVVSKKGQLIELNNSILSAKQVETVLLKLCNYTLSAYQDRISKGYITTVGGHRIGIGGKYYRTDKSYFIKEVTSLNLRLNRNRIYNIDKSILSFSKGLMVTGPPHSGKTTFLKNISRFLSGNISVCDERNELFSKNLPLDYISGIPKHAAIEQATRCLNPDYIICDEIGDYNEAKEILSRVNSGVKFICSVHADNEYMLMSKPNIKLLIDSGIFDRIVFLTVSQGEFYIKEIKDV